MYKDLYFIFLYIILLSPLSGITDNCKTTCISYQIMFVLVLMVYKSNRKGMSKIVQMEHIKISSINFSIGNA